MKVSQLMDLAEELNNTVEKFDVDIHRLKITIEDKEELKALCRLQSVAFYEPEIELPYYWAHLQLGRVAFALETEPVKFEFKIVE